MKKTLFVLSLALMTLLVLPNRVSALEIEVLESDGWVDAYENPDDVIGADIYHINTTSVPSSYWDLGIKEYDANLTEVGWQQLYTNYYFQPSSSGVLYLDYSIKGLESGYNPKVKIRLYEVNNSGAIKTYTIQTPANACIRISGLSQSKMYYFSFQAVKLGLSWKSATGTAKVYR